MSSPRLLVPARLVGAVVVSCVAAPNTAALAADPVTSIVCGTENLLAGKRPADQQDFRGDTTLVTDGAIGPEGALWDSPVAVISFSANGTLTYDLGQPRSISAVHIQADANDVYRVTGSLDGAPGSYRLVTEIENAFARGHGLRARAAQFAPVTVRYLRVGEGKGDGSYSISEFAAYCRAPSPFPPALRVVDAPLAEPARPPAGPVETPEKQSDRLIPMILALVLLLFGARGWLQARRSARGAAPDDKPASDAGASSAQEAPRTTSLGGEGAKAASTELPLRLLFLGSGCAALIYEVIWFHLLRLVIGASALSVGIVLAAFMGGMFLGSLLLPRLVAAEKNPVRVYALLEIGVGVFGLLMPIVLPAVRYVYVGLVGYGTLGIAMRAVIAALLLLPPTALMGATLPAIARRFSPGRRGMSSLASLYAANTIGAVAGCLVSAFYLLAVWDVWVATFSAAALNFIVGWGALRLGRTAPASAGSPAPAPPPANDKSGSGARPAWLTAVYLSAGLSGMTALGAQVIWTRLLTLLFGATVYAFAIILAVFLAGLGLGSAVAAYLLRRGQNAMRGLAWSQIALVPAVLTAAVLLANVLPYTSPPESAPVGALHGLHVLRALNVILPAALLWGMSFPFALAAAGSGHADTGRSSGHIYAVNTLGAIVGAIGISFWAIPAYGTRVAEQVIVVGAALSAAVLFRAVRLRDAPEPGTPRARTRFALPAPWALAFGIIAAMVLPGVSKVFLAHGRYISSVDPRDQYPYVSEGAASTVAVHINPEGYRNFHVSGRVEATNNPNDLRTERLIGHLSGMPVANPEAVLVVGLGGGITAGTLSLYPEVKRIVICEIEPRVVGAAKQFAPENYSVLSDPRVEIVFDDARHFLATTREKFDVITSDPIHPWVRGNSILFSREYYNIVKTRLKPGGIATQWVPLYETSEMAIKIQMRTFIDAFPNGTVWNTAVNGRGYDVVLVGGVDPLHLDLATIQHRIDANPRMAQSLKDVRIENAVDLMANYAASGPDMTAWLKGVPVNNDFSLKLEYISGMALNNKEADSIYAHMVADRVYPDNLFGGPPEVLADLRRRLQPATSAKR